MKVSAFQAQKRRKVAVLVAEFRKGSAPTPVSGTSRSVQRRKKLVCRGRLKAIPVGNADKASENVWEVVPGQHGLIVLDRGSVCQVEQRNSPAASAGCKPVTVQAPAPGVNGPPVRGRGFAHQVTCRANLAEIAAARKGPAERRASGVLMANVETEAHVLQVAKRFRCAEIAAHNPDSVSKVADGECGPLAREKAPVLRGTSTPKGAETAVPRRRSALMSVDWRPGLCVKAKAFVLQEQWKSKDVEIVVSRRDFAPKAVAGVDGPNAVAKGYVLRGPRKNRLAGSAGRKLVLVQGVVAGGIGALVRTPVNATMEMWKRLRVVHVVCVEPTCCSVRATGAPGAIGSLSDAQKRECAHQVWWNPRPEGHVDFVEWKSKKETARIRASGVPGRLLIAQGQENARPGVWILARELAVGCVVSPHWSARVMGVAHGGNGRM